MEKPITLTEQAARHVAAFLDRNQERVLRISLRRMGCSGWAFEVTGSLTPSVDDLVFESHGVTLAIAPEWAKLVEGTEIDFVKQGLNRVFEFHNPRIKDECGCGESFRFDEDAAPA